MKKEYFYLPTRLDFVHRLASYRADIEKQLGERSLLFVKTSPGLFLHYIVQVLGLTNDEQEVVLGGKLLNEVCQLMPEALEYVAKDVEVEDADVLEF